MRDKNPVAALGTIRSCLVEKPNSRPLNQMLFELMVGEADDFRAALEGPMRKAFTLEDGNVIMHVHAIRYYFMTGNAAKMTVIREAAMRMMATSGEKNHPRLRVANVADQQGAFRGTLVKVSPTFAFIQTPGLLQDVFLSPAGCADAEAWDDLREGRPVSYQLQFNVHGATATDVQLC